MTSKTNVIEMSSFGKGSVEEALFNSCGIDRKALELKHDFFTVKFVGEDLVFDMCVELQRILYNDDVTENYEESISLMDLIFSTYFSNSFNYVQSQASRLNLKEYEQDDEYNNLHLMCYMAMSYFRSKFDDIKNIEDIDRPVPLPLFIKVVSKQNDLEVAFEKDGEKFAGTLHHISIRKTMFSISIQVDLRMISKGKEGYVVSCESFQLPYVEFAQKMEDIGIKVLTPETKAEYTEKGRKYVKYTEKPTYCKHNGFAEKYGGWFGDIRTAINGRVMVDITAMRVLNASIDDRWYVGNPFGGKIDGMDKVSEDLLWMCSPVVYGFSFATKEWVKMSIESISDIEFSDKAFEELIVPEGYKKIFISSLSNDMPSLDSVEGKGSGKIFLLYGTPGVGKTMTAEAVAEYTRLPLYFVSVGELGITPEQMEARLEKLMSVATSWNAVVLLDEVDVFAIKRTGSDIQRNAMTAIFLRLLERYDGIMFMTTNLLDNLDDAFVSRATATIKYESLGSEDRKKIWTGILKKAENVGAVIDDSVYESLDSLCLKPFNGREIKNFIRLAYAMAASEGKSITGEILKSVVDLRTA